MADSRADDFVAAVERGLTLRAEIYGLFHPESGELRYIGKANNTQMRLKSHIRASKKRKTPVYCWFRSLAAIGLVPVAKVLIVAEDWKVEEKRLISEAKSRGERLLNVAEGGDEPFCSDEQRSKNGNVLSERLRSDPVFYFNRKFLTMVGRLAKTFSTSDPEKARRLKSRQETWAAMSIDDPDRLFQSYIRDNRIRSRLGILDEWIVYE